MDDPMACIERLYAHFDMVLGETSRARMEAYLAAKPKGKFGAHGYTVDASRASERPLFARYQALYNVPDEV
jgi:hypothetical protein